jgi:hypothetical protein
MLVFSSLMFAISFVTVSSDAVIGKPNSNRRPQLR